MRIVIRSIKLDILDSNLQPNTRKFFHLLGKNTRKAKIAEKFMYKLVLVGVRDVHWAFIVKCYLNNFPCRLTLIFLACYTGSSFLPTY